MPSTLLLLPAAIASAERPAPGNGYSSDIELLSFAPESSRVRVWYAASGDDAPPSADAEPPDGVPDYVATVADVGNASLERYAALGFREPLVDSEYLPLADAGGDELFDIYLKDFASADGSFERDACMDDTDTCVGHAVIENDFDGAGYGSLELSAKVVVSHELFHAVQSAYSADQDARWSEGSAVWAEELVFPEQDDFEHLIGAFLAKPDRPFDRATGSAFGDPYPYGAALWPTYLAERFGVELVIEIFEETGNREGSAADFLVVTADLLVDRGSSLPDAWEQFTRWNLFTGPRADPARSYAGGEDWAEVAFSGAVRLGSGPVSRSFEGLSAQYALLVLGALPAGHEVLLAADPPLPRATLYPVTRGEVGEALPLAPGDDGSFLHAPVADLGPGPHYLVVSSVDPGTPMRSMALDSGPVPEGSPEVQGMGGCSAVGSPDPGWLLVLVFLALGRSLCAHRGDRAKERGPGYRLSFALVLTAAFVLFFVSGGSP